MKRNWLAIVIYVGVILLFLPLQHFSDEYEHAMSGWFLLNGLIPYRDFFSHHAPLPLFAGLLGYALPFNPFISLRVWTLAFQLIIWWVIFKLTKAKFWPVIYLTMAMTVLAIPTFLFQAALANNLVNFSLILMMILLANYWFNQTPAPFQIIQIYAVLSVICLWSSIASVLPIVVLSGLLGLILTIRHSWPQPNKILKIGLLTLLVHLIFPLFYLLKHSLSEFIWSVFTYNTKYYFPLRLAQTPAELRYGALFQIANQFGQFLSQNLSTFIASSLIYLRAILGGLALFSVADFSPVKNYYQLITMVWLHNIQPFLVVLSLSWVLGLIGLILTKRYKLAFIYPILSLSLFFRSNEIFHLAPLYFLIILNLSWQTQALKKFYRLVPVLGLIVLILGLSAKFIDTLITRPPLILAQDQKVAQLITEQTDENDPVMVLDASMVYYPLAHRLPGCLYHYYLPWLDQTPVIHQHLEKCLRNQTAQIIIIPDPNQPFLQNIKPLLETYYASDSGGLWWSK